MEEDIAIWANKPEITTILKEIEAMNISSEEAAKLAFDRIPVALNLPRLPEDIDEDEEVDYENPDIERRSVFDELAILSYLHPEENRMDLLIASLYNLSHQHHSDIYDAAVKFYGTEELVPAVYFVYFFGRGVDAKIDFEIKGGNWVEAGAKGMWQIISGRT